MEPCYLSLYSLHLCSLFPLRVPVTEDCSIFLFSDLYSFIFLFLDLVFLRQLCSRTPLVAMIEAPPRALPIVIDDLRWRWRCHAGPHVLLTLAVVSLYDFNFANSYQYIQSHLLFIILCTIVNDVSVHHLVFEGVSGQFLVFAVSGHHHRGMRLRPLCGPIGAERRGMQ